MIGSGIFCWHMFLFFYQTSNLLIIDSCIYFFFFYVPSGKGFRWGNKNFFFGQKREGFGYSFFLDFAIYLRKKKKKAIFKKKNVTSFFGKL